MVYHNHNWNDMFYNYTGPAHPGAITQSTPSGSLPYGTQYFTAAYYGLTYSGQYYTAPWCVNMDSVSRYVDHCNAGW